MSKKTTIVFVISAFVLILLGVGLLSFLSNRRISAVNSCINNLRQIDAAKQQWALDSHKATNDVPTWDVIRPFLGRGASADEITVCPQGGTYTLGSVGEYPKCSIGGLGHSLQVP